MTETAKYYRATLSQSVAAAAFSLAIVLGTTGAAGATVADDQAVGSLAQETSLAGSFLSAQIASKANDDEAAVAFYERSLELDPKNEELKQALFLALSANGRIADAVKLARDNFLNSNGPGFARVVVAVDAIKRKSFAQVSEILNKPASADLDGLVDELILAWAQFGTGDTAGAIEAARIFNGPEWVGAIRFYHAGLMAMAAGDDSQAIEYFRETKQHRAVAGLLTETYLRAIEGLARAQGRGGDTEGALLTLEEGQSLLSSHPPFLALKATLEAGRVPAPLITGAGQGAAEVFYNVGAAISRQNGAPFAQSYLQLADFLYPESDPIAMTLAGLFESQQSYERSNRYYEEIKPASSYYRRSRIEYALNLNDLERIDEAKETLRSLIESEPDDLLAHMTLGGILSQHKEYEAAASVYDAAVDQLAQPDEAHWNLFYRRGIAYERLKEWEKAEPNFRKSLELSPEQPDVLNYLGYSWIDMGMNLDEGMDMIRKAVDLRPKSGFIVDSLGWAYYKLGEYEKAVVELEKAVELMPEDPVINDHLGDAYWKVGRRLEATFQWKHAMAFDPELEDKINIRLKLNNGLKEKPDAAVSSN